MTDLQLADRDLPSLFQAADKASLDGQAAAVKQNLVYLSLTMLAAVGGLLDVTVKEDSINVGGLFATVAFAAALFVGLTAANSR